MQVTVKRDKPETVVSDVLILFLWQATPPVARSPIALLDTRLEGLISDYIKSGDFSGSLNSTALLRSRDKIGAARVLLVGLGKAEKFQIDYVRQASATAVTAARKLGVSNVTLLPPACDLEPMALAQALAEGALMGLYTMKKYKTVTEENDKDRLSEVYVLANATTEKAYARGVERGHILAEAVNMARDLGNSPGNDVTPTYLAETAHAIAEGTSLQCRVLRQEDMQELNMGCLLGVAQGSEQPPAFIILDHAPQGTQEQPIVLIGKGLTFDSGGISIKPAANMEDMKMDMSGGATVLGTMQALARLKYPRRVMGLVPSSENLLNGKAVKPGDILKAMSGKTVEVINTDAEGRLILADALAYAVQELKPACMVDLATLTGAVVVALGSHATGMMGTDDTLMESIKSAGDRTGERVWQLPLFDEYSKQIKSDFADLKNVAANREAGSIIGGAFLKEFAGETPWVHLDIAGTAWTRENKPYIPKGATGVGIRLLVDTLEHMSTPAAPPAAATSKKAPTKSRAKVSAKA
jgi:leucyl aminopeptidase